MSKQHKTKPSVKQKKAITNYIENHGNASKAMRDAGYTEATAKNPSNLTKSKAFLAFKLVSKIGVKSEMALKICLS